MDEKIAERRRHQRVRSRLPLEYKNLGESESTSRGSLIRDISEGGVRFTSEQFLSLANRLVITINVPTSVRQVKVIAKVAWIKKGPLGDRYDVGNQFLEITKEDKVELAKYVKTVSELDISF